MTSLVEALAALGLLLSAETGPLQGLKCAPRDDLLELLKDRYGEARDGFGHGATGVLVEHFESVGGATWTITMTLPNGLSCLVLDGRNWRRVVPAGEGT